MTEHLETRDTEPAVPLRCGFGNDAIEDAESLKAGIALGQIGAKALKLLKNIHGLFLPKAVKAVDFLGQLVVEQLLAKEAEFAADEDAHQ